MSKFNDWYDNLDPKTKKYLESQPIYHGKDLLKSSLFGAFWGFIVGLIVGYQLGWEPVVTTFRPLVG